LGRGYDECDTEKDSAPPRTFSSSPGILSAAPNVKLGGDACRSAEDVVQVTGQQPLGFEEIAQALRPKLHRYCARMAGSAIDGEDIVQDALLKAMEAFPRDGSIANPEAWLFRIAHNTALDFLRRRLRLEAVVARQAEEDIADPDDEITRRQIAAMSLRPS
jgi:DNA-directed RNA polymerase specialized sigma24 family protein